MRSIRETSAGGVIYRRNKGELEIALIHVRRRWGLPKGHLEAGESAEGAALREVREETGLEGRVAKKLGTISYSYRESRREREPVRIYKRVHFYLLRYLRGDVRDHDQEEVDEARWFPIHEALNNLRFASEKKIVRRAISYLTAEPPRVPAGEKQDSAS